MPGHEKQTNKKNHHEKRRVCGPHAPARLDSRGSEGNGRGAHVRLCACRHSRRVRRQPPRDGIDPDGVRIGQMLAGRRPGRQHARLRPPRGRPPAGEDAGRGALGRDRRGPLRRRPYRQDLLRGRGRVEVAHAGQRQLPGHAHRRDARVSHLWRGANDHPRAPAGRPCRLRQVCEKGQGGRGGAALAADHRPCAEGDAGSYPV